MLISWACVEGSAFKFEPDSLPGSPILSLAYDLDDKSIVSNDLDQYENV
jgi:hypothetical protein